MTIPLYLTVKKLCNKLEEFNDVHMMIHQMIDHINSTFLSIKIISFLTNASKIVCKSLLVSIFKHQQFLYKELCEFFDYENVYLCFNEKGRQFSFNISNNSKTRLLIQ